MLLKFQWCASHTQLAINNKILSTKHGNYCKQFNSFALSLLTFFPSLSHSLSLGIFEFIYENKQQEVDRRNNQIKDEEEFFVVVTRE